MNFSKLLATVLAFGASAEMSTFIGAGVSAGYVKPAFETGKNIIPATLKGAGALSLGDSFKESSDSGADFAIEENTDIKGFVPGGLFLSAIVTFDKLVGALSLGLGLEGGYRYNFGLPTDKIYGDKLENSTAAKVGFAITAPTGSFYMVPKVLIGMDIADIHILLSIGMDISYAAHKITLAKGLAKLDTDNNGDVDSDAKAWLFGVRFGLEAIFQVAPCAGVGLGVHFTYWPEAMNDVKEEGVAKKFYTKAQDKDVVFNVGGTWAIAGSITGHFAFG